MLYNELHSFAYNKMQSKPDFSPTHCTYSLRDQGLTHIGQVNLRQLHSILSIQRSRSTCSTCLSFTNLYEHLDHRTTDYSAVAELVLS